MNDKKYKNISNVIIVGGGMAGLYAANTAARNNPKLKVTLLTNEELGSGGCSKRTHGINAAMNPNDSCELHYNDTIKGGAGINNSDLAKTLCTDIIDRLKELEAWGVRFSKNEDGYDVGTYGGSTNSRSIHRYDITGLEIVQELVKRSILHGIFIKEYRWVIDLIYEDSSCYGVRALNLLTRKIEDYYAKSVVLATGGGACVYPISSISNDKLATGILMGYDAGVPLIDMEMVQFHPTGILIKGSPGNGSLLEEEMRNQGGILLNRDGKRYMFDYDGRGELATRDIVARSSYLEIMQGRGTENNGVIFDISEIDKKYLLKRFPKTVKRIRCWDVDLITQDKLEVSPTAHFLMGGLIINKYCETDLKGLFVCGEDAGGIHGGNRLGGNGVADALVFGYISGLSAANYSKECELPKINIQIAELNYYDLSLEEIENIDNKIKDVMWKNVGVVRESKKLGKALEQIEELKEGLIENLTAYKEKDNTYPDELLNGRILFNKLRLSLLIIKSAIARTNSLGAHYRSDSNIEKKKYNIVINKKGSVDEVIRKNLVNEPEFMEEKVYF